MTGYLLTGYATIARSPGAAGGEDVTISVVCRADSDVIRCRSDIINDQNDLLAEGPAAAFTLISGNLEPRAVDEWLAQVKSFLFASKTSILTELQG